ncbi:MAG: HNH endonuclease [Mediterraneibacter gnavus]
METVMCEVSQQRISHEKQCKRIATTSKRGKRKILYQRQDGKCAICGRALQIDDYTSMENYLTIDHIFPLSRGGVNTIDNLQGLCRSCNSMKSDIV